MLVGSRIFEWNSLENDLVLLYIKLVEPGTEYRDGKVYLADLEEPQGKDSLFAQYWNTTRPIVRPVLDADSPHIRPANLSETLDEFLHRLIPTNKITRSKAQY